MINSDHKNKDWQHEIIKKIRQQQQEFCHSKQYAPWNKSPFGKSSRIPNSRTFLLKRKRRKVSLFKDNWKVSGLEKTAYIYESSTIFYRLRQSRIFFFLLQKKLAVSPALVWTLSSSASFSRLAPGFRKSFTRAQAAAAQSSILVARNWRSSFEGNSRRGTALANWTNWPPFYN